MLLSLRRGRPEPTNSPNDANVYAASLIRSIRLIRWPNLIHSETDPDSPDSPSNVEEPPPTRLQILRLAILVEGGLAGFAVLLAWIVGRNLFEGMRWDMAGIGTGIAATAPLFLFLALAVRSQAGPFVRIRRILDDVLLPWLSPCRMIDLLLLALFAGIGEELLFRAFLQSVLADAFHSPVAGLIVASLLFGVCHWITTDYVVLTSIAGFYLGAVWLAADGNTLVVMIAHSLYDFVALVLLLKWHRAKSPESAGAEQTGAS